MSLVKKKILVIDDERSVRRFLSHSLEASGFDVKEAETGAEGIRLVIEQKPDIIVLDHGLPDMTGIEVLRKLREWSKTPVIFLTVRDRDEDKVEALDSGADDYLTKPFSLPELLARLRVALRHAEPKSSSPVIKAGVIEIDRESHIVRAGGKEVKLSATEFTLLALLGQHLGKTIAHRQILRDIWGPNSVEHDHYLRVYFSQIRKKLNAALPGAGDLIENESGVGYRLNSASEN